MGALEGEKKGPFFFSAGENSVNDSVKGYECPTKGVNQEEENPL